MRSRATPASASVAIGGRYGSMRDMRALSRPVVLLAWLALLGGCARPHVEAPQRRPAEVRAQIARLLPADTTDRAG
jgi:hypothetical protein